MGDYIIGGAVAAAVLCEVLVFVAYFLAADAENADPTTVDLGDA